MRAFCSFLALCAGAAAAEPSLERGTYLVEGPAGCGNCHTPISADGQPAAERALAGRVVQDSPEFIAIGANLTPAGRIAGWTDAELARAIREGIRPDGTVIGPPMPIGLYRGLSDDDLMSIVIYLRQAVKPVENDPGTSIYHIPLPPAYGPPIESVSAPAPGVTVEYGEYLAGPVAHCMECHTTFGPQGPMFETHLGAGGYEFPGPGGMVMAPNLTPHEDGIARYTDAELDRMIRQGLRPDGSSLSPPMPTHWLAKMTDEDVQAILLYLRSLDPLPLGGE